MGRRPRQPWRLSQLVLSDFDDATDVANERSIAHLAAPASVPAAAPPSSDAWLYVALGVMTGLAIAFAVWALWPSGEPEMTRADVDTAIVQVMATQAPEPAASGADAYEKIAPSLVVIRAIRDGDTVDTSNGSNLGGGVIINDQGQVITANHVIAGADTIELVFGDGTTTTGHIDATSVALDIAVLSPTSSIGVPVPAVLGNSRTLRIGDPIYAVGNPLGLTGTLSAGVISGLGRSIPFPGETDLVLHDLIQFDAAINQGSSGGPLLNSDGHVIGIVTALADPGGQGFFVGIGFAMPIEIAAAGAANGPSQ